MNPTISVIIPVYNGLPYIEKALESVLKQSYAAHQIIVINDGSTDGTDEVLLKFKEAITVKKIQNSGAADARNNGIRMATGDYLAFLDADDLWFKNKLEVHAEYIRRYPSVGFFSSNYFVRYPEWNHRIMKHSGTISHFNRLNPDHPMVCNAFKALLLCGNFVGTPSAVVVKRSLAEEAGFFKSNHLIAEDLHFFMDVAVLTNFLFISQALFYKRTHSTNSSTDKARMYEQHLGVLKDVLLYQEDFVRLHGLRKIADGALSDVCYKIGNLYFEAGYRRRAFSMYAQARSYSHGAINQARYCWEAGKKAIRVMTFDKINRKSFLN